ncbi:hypothetical protein DFQ28_010481 [Apophysomyces sp. BC1034]|nr:hypothetical protein DFQ30_001618 [Apophysomyces sp. BC1015]KAG0191955.1 hypothetical protein DFQ28_010481 [Apophysomyces sp. BC1034]
MHAAHSVSHLHLLLPFALPAAADAQATLQGLDKPALDKLLERASLVERENGEDFQRTLPHERWVTRRFGVGRAATPPAGGGQGRDTAPTAHDASSPAANDDTPLAPYMLLADGGKPRDAVWACVEPVHVQVTHDHLALIDPEMLELSTEDAATLLALARPLIEALGVELAAPTPLRWYLSSEQLGTLAGAAPLRAAGRNIEIWLPREAHTGHRSRAWMKLQNEVQMAWFEHPVNQAREARGLPAANSIWLHAQGRIMPVSRPFERVLSHAAATRGLALACGAALGAPPPSLAMLRQPIDGGTDAGAPAHAGAGGTLVELGQLSAPFIQQDWPRFRAMFATLERDWFAPALAALQRGELAELTLTLCGDTGSTTLTVRRIDLKKFWRRRPFASLLQ